MKKKRGEGNRPLQMNEMWGIDTKPVNTTEKALNDLHSEKRRGKGTIGGGVNFGP